MVTGGAAQAAQAGDRGQAAVGTEASKKRNLVAGAVAGIAIVAAIVIAASGGLTLLPVAMLVLGVSTMAILGINAFRGR